MELDGHVGAVDVAFGALRIKITTCSASARIFVVFGTLSFEIERGSDGRRFLFS